MKSCPYCAEDIQDAAIVCKHCGRDLATGLPPAQERAPSPGVAAVLSLVIPGAGQMYAGRVGSGFAWLFFVVLGYMAFVLPGLVLHVVCVISAYSAASRRPPVAPSTAPPDTAPAAARDPNESPAAAASSTTKLWTVGLVIGAGLLAIAVFDRRELPTQPPEALTSAHLAAVARGMDARAYNHPSDISLVNGVVTATYAIRNDLAIPPRRFAEDRLGVIRAALDSFGFEAYAVEVHGTPGAPEKAWGTATVSGLHPVEWHPR